MSRGNRDKNTSNGVASTKRFHWNRKKILKSLCVVAMLVVALLGVFFWQHHQVSTKSSLVSSLSDKTAQLEKKNVSLNKQVYQLNKSLQSVESSISSSDSAKSKSSTNTASAATTASTTPTSNLVVTDVKQIPASTYNSFSTSSDTYEEVDFTIYNNSSSTQTYELDMENSYVKGVTASGTVETPYALISGSAGAAWNNSTLLPGGSANGFALFDLNTPLDIVSLDWLSPGDAQPVYIDLPN